MPEIRYYKVKQIREIKISANNLTDAALLSERVFSNTKLPGDQINIQQSPREIDLIIKEDRFIK